MATKFITISIEIMHDKKLSPNQKFILAEIQQLVSLEKGCIGSNQHFSKLIGINRSGVSKAIKSLENMGYISTEITKGTRNRERIITLLGGSSGKLGGSSGQESKENKTINARNQDLEAFEVLWKDYTLTFLKQQNRGGGSKAKAKAKYLELNKKYSSEDIYKFAENHCTLSIGHKDLERLLVADNIKQFFEDKS